MESILQDQNGENNSQRGNDSNGKGTDYPDMTVEEYLRSESEKAINRIKAETDMMEEKIKREYEQLKQEFRQNAGATAPEKRPTKPMINLTVKEGTYKGSSFSLSKPKAKTFAWIGRSKTKAFTGPRGVSLPKDSLVSEKHGKFSTADGSVVYIDNKSSNGSLLNGNPVPPKTQVTISDGDEMMIGSNKILINLT
mmetsp:Transcript_13501/g.22041  ORF Transcript_13501/g.22041 Transcript_13501/m.22041 type:complete len:195 (+) Transcript_13501:156-740(+)